MRTTQSRSRLKYVYATGISFIFACTCLGLSTLYLAGNYIYRSYLESKPVESVDSNRQAVEAKHRELLKKSGFKYSKSELNLDSIPTENLKLANQKLEKVLRSGL